MSRKVILLAAFGLIMSGIACKSGAEDSTWSDRLFSEGKMVFYQAINEDLAAHPKKNLLTEAEKAKIHEAATRYPRLYGLIVNIYYQKEAPELRKLLAENSREARKKFSEKYLEIVRFSALNFVEAFFLTDWTTDWIRKNMAKYKDLDAVDLVIRTIGHDAKLAAPDPQTPPAEISPEFQNQGALKAGRFIEAHRLTRGKGAKIAILDTGIDERHPIFKNTLWGRHFSLVGREGKPWDTDVTVVDWGWHGTLISSIATVYAPEAQLTMYKFGDGETQNEPAYQLLMHSIIAACIYKAVDDGNDIISISASGASLDAEYLREAVSYAHAKNRVVISGNLYSKWFKQGNTLNFPGQYPTVISVTAAEKKKDGTYGYWDVCAPDKTTAVAAANDIFGAFPLHAKEKDAYVPSISAAIPTVAALCAMVVSAYPPLGTEKPGEYADAVRRLVLENANPQAVGFKGFSPECGYGLIDALKTVEAAVKLNAVRAGKSD